MYILLKKTCTFIEGLDFPKISIAISKKVATNSCDGTIKNRNILFIKSYNE